MSENIGLSKSKTKEIMFSAVGNVLVWYDFALFMPFLPIIARQFFPIEDPALRDILSFLVMSAGLFCRPVGSLLFGPFGDVFGRKFVLCLTVLMMAVSSLFIGCIPFCGYSKNGAGIALLAMRIAQGLAMGGAYTAAMVQLVETAPQNRRGLFGSFSDVGNQIGVLMAGGSMLALHLFFSESEIYRYAWTIPFLLSGLIIPFVLIPLYKERKKLKKEKEQEKKERKNEDSEKADLSAASSSSSSPTLSSKEAGIFRSLIIYKKQVLCTFSITAFSAVAFYTLLSFLPYYLVNKGMLNLKDIATCNVVTNTFMITSILIGGYLSDIFGRKIFLRLGIICVAVCNYIIFLSELKSLVAWLIIHAVYGSFLGLYYGGRAAFFAESFPKKIRCTGVSFSLSIAQAIFGGGIAIVLNYLLRFRFAIVIPITLTVIFALWAIAVMRDRRKAEME